MKVINAYIVNLREHVHSALYELENGKWVINRLGAYGAYQIETISKSEAKKVD